MTSSVTILVILLAATEQIKLQVTILFSEGIKSDLIVGAGEQGSPPDLKIECVFLSEIFLLYVNVLHGSEQTKVRWLWGRWKSSSDWHCS